MSVGSSVGASSTSSAASATTGILSAFTSGQRLDMYARLGSPAGPSSADLGSPLAWLMGSFHLMRRVPGLGESDSADEEAKGEGASSRRHLEPGNASSSGNAIGLGDATGSSNETGYRSDSSMGAMGFELVFVDRLVSILMSIFVCCAVHYMLYTLPDA